MKSCAQTENEKLSSDREKLSSDNGIHSSECHEPCPPLSLCSQSEDNDGELAKPTTVNWPRTTIAGLAPPEAGAKPNCAPGGYTELYDRMSTVPRPVNPARRSLKFLPGRKDKGPPFRCLCGLSQSQAARGPPRLGERDLGGPRPAKARKSGDQEPGGLPTQTSLKGVVDHPAQLLATLNPCTFP